MKLNRYPVLVLSVIILLPFTNLALSNSNALTRVPAQEVLFKLSHHMPVEYDNVIIVGDLELGNMRPNDDYKILENEQENLSGSQVIRLDSPIKITNSIINGNLSSSACIFEAPLIFSSTNFQQNTSFRGSRFNRETLFHGCNFNKNCDFSFTNFNHDADIFQAAADFEDTTFNGYANFGNSDFFGSMFFGGSTFLRGCDFENSWFKKTACYNYTDFSDDANFKRCRFFDDAYFYKSKFYDSADFAMSIFLKSADFSWAYIGKNLKLNNSVFWDDVLFTKSSFIGDLIIHFTVFKSNFIVEWNDIKNKISADKGTYFNLVKIFKNMGLEGSGGAIDCYYLYKKEIMKDDKGIYNFQRSIWDHLQWIVWGFGVRPWYTFSFSLCLIVLFGAFYSMTKLISAQIKPRANYSNIIFIWSIVFFILWGYLTYSFDIYHILFFSCCFLFLYIFLFYAFMNTITNNMLFSFNIFFAYNPYYSWKIGTNFDFIILFERILGWLLTAIFIGTLINISWPFTW
ncbi:Pentapeptide repeats (9 copies) [uncultured archaeon]|nr:Pentapeptide repeats (9 copies) [uncultured archaeon]